MSVQSMLKEVAFGSEPRDAAPFFPPAGLGMDVSQPDPTQILLL